jgi:tRNA A37 threonylcarbamoyladenosine dehydratase
MGFFGMGGSEDDQVSATSVNTEDGFSSLFKDIGNTLVDVTKQGLSTVASTVKTNLANRIIGSPEGKAQIAAYKMDYIMKYLPWMALAALGIFIGGKFFTRS